MKHYLNVCDVNGAEVEAVDLITFGSPCQDLSVAGKRAGLKHESNGDDETTRSGLFMEAVRIIKEMRKADEFRQLRSGRSDGYIHPRFAVWENVPGAFSSNNGYDFRVVLEELARVKDAEVSVPMPEKGKWKPAGEIVGDGWSIAWRTLDAQYHGVPQRRRRIFLVADFAGECAGEILFECEGLPGYPAQSGEAWEGTSADTPSGTGRTGEGNNGIVPYTLQIRSGCEGGGKGPLIQTDKSACLTAAQTQTLFQPVVCVQGSMIGRKDENGPQGSGVNEDVAFTLNTTDRHAIAYGISSFDSNAMKSANPHSGIYEADTSRTLDLNGGNPACNQGGICICEQIECGDDLVLFENHGQDSRYTGPLDVVPTLSAKLGTGGNNTPFVCEKRRRPVLACGEDVCPTLTVGDFERCRYNNESLAKPVCVPAPMSWDGSQVAPTLTTRNASGSQRMPDKEQFNCVLQPMTYAIKDEGFMDYSEEVAATLKARDYKQPQAICYAIDREAFNCSDNFAQSLRISDDGIAPTLIARGPSANCACESVPQSKPVLYQDVIGTLCASDYKFPQQQQVYENKCIVEYSTKWIVRRLTPTECARLQGMPDEWCRLSTVDDMSDEDFEFWTEAQKKYAEINGTAYKKKTKEQMIAWYNKLRTDGAEYKAYGNGMALPCVRVPIHGIAKHGAKTMASLFDGIGGFPLAGVLDGIKTLWTSEIELFPIAVTLERFREYEKYGFFTFGYEVSNEKISIEKEKKEMELKVESYQLPESISFNFEELKSELEARVHTYEVLLYTDDQIKEAKADRASLNKLKKALNDERIRLEREYMAPFTEFKSKISEIIAIIDRPVELIDKQVKAYEDKQKADKREAIESFFAGQKHPEWLILSQIFDEKWLNASVSIKSVQDAIIERLKQIENDLATLDDLPEFGFEAVQVYKSTLDITKAITEGHRLAEIARKKAEFEATQAARLAEQMAAVEIVKPVEEVIPAEEVLPEIEAVRTWIAFEANLTVDDATELREFFIRRGIEFRAI